MKFKNRNLIGNDEIREVNKVLKSGKLSSFVAEKGPEHHGGKYVKNLNPLLKHILKLNMQFQLIPGHLD